MSLALKTPSETTPIHEPEIGFLAIEPTRSVRDLDRDSALQNELDQLLARKPVAKPTASRLTPANSNLVDFDAVAGDDGFSWQPEIGEAQPKATSAIWIDKARLDRRSSSRRNAVAWVATVVIGAAILAALAYLLVGWRPDLSAAYAVVADWLS